MGPLCPLLFSLPQIRRSSMVQVCLSKRNATIVAHVFDIPVHGGY